MSPSRADKAPRTPAPHAAFFVHMLPRFVSDFAALANTLATRGTVDVFAPVAEPGAAAWYKRPAELEAAGRALVPAVTLRELPLQRDHLTPRAMIRTWRLAWREGRRHPDAWFFLWTYIPFALCGLPLRLQGRRCVFMATGLGSVFGSDTPRMRALRPFVKLLYRFLFGAPHSRVLVHNVEDRAYLHASLGIRLEHIQVTPGCGVDPAEYPRCAPPRHPRPVIGVPVRLIVEKGVADAVRASMLLHERGVDHEMWFSSDLDAGNPSSLTAADLERFRALSSCVRFLGHLPRVQQLYTDSDIVLIPTRYREGLPTALLESAAVGRPIVATDNVGCRDFMVHERTGLVVPRGDARAMADALERLIRDPALAERLGDQAHEHFLAGFTKQEMVDRTLALLAGYARDAGATREVVPMREREGEHGMEFDRCNLAELELEDIVAHGGEGRIRFRRIADAASLAGACDFMDIAELPPGASVGRHTHGADEEEFYLILSGRGEMWRDGAAFDVRAGDLIRNRPAGSHGLVNTGGEPLRMFVFQVPVPRSA